MAGFFIKCNTGLKLVNSQKWLSEQDLIIAEACTSLSKVDHLYSDSKMKRLRFFSPARQYALKPLKDATVEGQGCREDWKFFRVNEIFQRLAILNNFLVCSTSFCQQCHIQFHIDLPRNFSGKTRIKKKERKLTMISFLGNLTSFTMAHRISETNSSFHVKQRTAGKL